jgi:hypothetical protein
MVYKSGNTVVRSSSYSGAMRKHASFRPDSSPEREILNTIAHSAKTAYRGVIVRKGNRS